MKLNKQTNKQFNHLTLSLQSESMGYTAVPQIILENCLEIGNWQNNWFSLGIKGTLPLAALLEIN